MPETEEVAPPTENQPTDPPAKADPPAETDWKAEARKWEQRAKDNATQLKNLKPKADQFDQLEAASRTELEKAQQAATDAQAKATGLTLRAVRAEVRAGATGFIDSDVPFAYLDLTSFVGDDGEIDNAKITTELAELLKRKPELAKPSGEPQRRVPAPNPAQGSSASGSPEFHAQLESAKKAGDWRTVLKLENQKLLDQPVQ